MAKPYHKFRTAHKFGKKRKKTRTKRDYGAGAPEAQPAQDGVATSSVEMSISPPVSAAASDGVSDRQRGTRLDTTFLTSADRARQQKQTEDKIASLSATSASERKLRMLATAREDSDPSAATYGIVDFSAINKLLERTTKCRTCNGTVSIEKAAGSCTDAGDARVGASFSYGSQRGDRPTIPPPKPGWYSRRPMDQLQGDHDMPKQPLEKEAGHSDKLQQGTSNDPPRTKNLCWFSSEEEENAYNKSAGDKHSARSHSRPPGRKPHSPSKKSAPALTQQNLHCSPPGGGAKGNGGDQGCTQQALSLPGSLHTGKAQAARASGCSKTTPTSSVPPTALLDEDLAALCRERMRENPGFAALVGQGIPSADASVPDGNGNGGTSADFLAHRSKLMQAFEALLDFFSEADLITCL
ncbi:hypothetical protein MRX96_005804 [Rhipicephalus microplus]